MEPLHTLNVVKLPHLLTSIPFIGTGLLFAELNERRYRSMQRLARSEARYRALFEAAPLGIGVIDSQNARILAANPRYAAIVGRTPEEMATLDWTQITHPEDIQPDLDNMARFNAGEIPGFQMDKRYLKPDGGMVWVSMTVAPIAVAAGERPQHMCMVEDITDRKQTEAALRQAEARYARAERGTQDGIWDWDIITGEDYHSPRYRELLGYGGGEYPDTVESFKNIVHPKDLPQVMTAVQAHQEQHAPFDIELRLRTRTGDYRWFQSRGQAEWDAAGRPVRMAGSIRDITQQKAAAAALSQAAERYRLIRDTADAGFWLVDPLTGQLLDVNEAAVQMSGYSREALLSMRIADLEVQESAAAVTLHRERIRQRGYDRFETQHRTRAGGVINVEVSAAFDPGSNTFVAFLRDITERKRAEAALRASEAKFALAFNTLPVGMLITRQSDGLIMEVNPAFEAMVASTRAELIGHTVLELKLWANPDEQERFLAEIPELRTIQQRECQIRRRNGEIMTGLLSASLFKPEEEWLLLGSILDITQQKQAEAALRASEAKFAMAFNALPLGMLITRLTDGKIIEVNPAFEAMVAATRAEVIGHTTLELNLWEDAEDRERFQTEIRELGSVHQREYRFRRRNGEIMTGLLSASPFKPDEEWLLLGNILDITEQKQAEAALRESEERFRMAFDNSNAGMCLVDLKGRLFRVNRQMSELFGYSQAELEAMTVDDLTHPEDLHISHDYIRRALNGESQSQLFEKRYRHRQGHIIHGLTTPALVRDAQGQPLYFITQVQDITDRKRAEAALRESEFRWKFAIEGSGDGVWDSNLVTEEVQYSKRWKAMLGYAEDEILPLYQEWLDRIHPDDQNTVAKTLQGYLDGEVDPYVVEYRLRCKDGRYKWILSRGIAVQRDEDGKVLRMIGTHTDINERKAAEQALAEAKTQAEAANRAKSQFLALMSHEIRTPMNGVLGLAQLLEQEPLADESREMVRQIRDSGQLLLGIINYILDFSKIEVGQLQLEQRPFSLSQSLDHVLHAMANAAVVKGLDLRLETAGLPEDGGWLGDALRLEQILFNLVGNAIKFTEQGEVVIRVRALAATGEAAVRLRFEVADTGIGLTPEAMARLFTPFEQADGSITRRFGGTGLGLSICKRLVGLMGGAIGVDSQPGNGSVFWFEAPFARAAGEALPLPAPVTATAAAPTPEGESGPRLAGLRVLVVDDNQINRVIVERALQREGAVATLAVDGQQALDVLKAQSGMFDVVLMDIQMPVLDGLSATRAIRRDAALAQLPVFALTAGVMAEEREAALAAGMNDFIAKPVDLTLMVAMLSRHAGRD